MCRARLGSKAPAWARLETARACKKCEPGPSRGLTASSGPAQALLRSFVDFVTQGYKGTVGSSREFRHLTTKEV